MKQLRDLIREISNSSNLNEENFIDKIKNALREKDSDAFRKWREDGFNVNHLFYGEDTLLHLAAEKDSIEMVEALIKNGSNVNTVGYFDEAPLHHAARYGEVEVMQILIKNGANVNAVDELENTPLHTAIIEAPGCLKTETVKVLIKNGADVNTVNGYDKGTPLLSAADISENVEIVKVLIENGADVNVVDYLGDTPLHRAAKDGCTDIVQILMKNGANIIAINEYERDTPLHFAAYYNHLEIVKYLVDKGADVHAKNIKRKLPLDRAKEKGYDKIVEYLTDKMATIPHSKDKALQTYQNECFDDDVFLTDYYSLRENKKNEGKEENPLKKKSWCSIY